MFKVVDVLGYIRAQNTREQLMRICICWSTKHICLGSRVGGMVGDGSRRREMAGHRVPKIKYNIF